jgi:hypothetical protein
VAPPNTGLVTRHPANGVPIALSMLGLLGSVGLWVGSYFAESRLSWHKHTLRTGPDAEAFEGIRDERTIIARSGVLLYLRSRQTTRNPEFAGGGVAGRWVWDGCKLRRDFDQPQPPLHPFAWGGVRADSTSHPTSRRDPSGRLTGDSLEVPLWWPVVLASAALAAWAFRPGLRRRRALWLAARRRCPACGYDLTGNASGTCPECGASPAGAVA